MLRMPFHSLMLILIGAASVILPFREDVSVPSMMVLEFLMLLSIPAFGAMLHTNQLLHEAEILFLEMERGISYQAAKSHVIALCAYWAAIWLPGLLATMYVRHGYPLDSTNLYILRLRMVADFAKVVLTIEQGV
jgi:hypothetical protein